MLAFHPASIPQKYEIEEYLYRYGENSCQHSFVAMYCMESKYHDKVCLDDGYLFTLRQGKCTETERYYLYPLGDTENQDALRNALQKILDDAHENHRKVRFETLTANAAQFLKSLCPNQFTIEPCRDWFEYIYAYNTLANLPGGKLASKRYDIKTFFRDFEGRTVIRKIQPDDIDDILRFQKIWLTEKQHEDEDVQLDYENLAIQKGLAHYEELGLSGIVVFIDGALCGYAYGAPLSDTAYDVIIEKGDRSYKDIYKILNRELVRLCCDGYLYINREEDAGVDGLRKAKLSYQPDILMEKYIAVENSDL
ncbi:MAG: DUF2156 domain-containing protein [Victivallales bacterium]|nr:DUF2156 domain-containing protein [Victivallales bacterium]